MARIIRTASDLPRSVWAIAAAALVVWLAVTVPLAAGWRTLYFRDVFGNHLPVKAFGAEALARGEVPAVDPQLGMGQPFRGNPATLAFYPDNLLYLALPLWSAFNLHFALHWLLAALAMAVLARELGMRPHATLLAALTYGGSGFVLSGLSFYNVITVVAWWPLAMAGAVRGGRRGTAAGGVACGLALLGGEPLLAALGLLPMVVAAVERHGGRRGVATVGGVGLLGLAVALPQIVATLRVLGFTFRGSHGNWATQVTAFTLSPVRYLELVLPLPFGWPMTLGPRGWWLWRTADQGVYFLSLYCGVVALWLAARALRRRPVWGVLAAGGLALAWLAGGAGETLAALTAGTFRYPEKLLFWPALALPLLAGWGLEAAVERPGPPRRWAWGAGGALALAALAGALARPRLLAAAAAADPGGPLPFAPLVAAQSLLAIAGLALAGALLLAAGWAIGRRRPGVVVGLQLAALLQLFPLVDTAPTAPFRRPPPWLARLPPGAGVLHTLTPRPGWEPTPAVAAPVGSRWRMARRGALDLDAVPGALRGLRYPLWPDKEGFSSPLYTYLTMRLALADWDERVPWLRAVGVDAVVAHRRPPPHPALVPVAHGRHLIDSWLLRVESPAPEAWWPRRVETAPGPAAAFAQVAAQTDPVATVVASRPVVHDPAGTARLVAAAPDRLEIDVESAGGGLLVLRRSYHPIYRARAGGRRLDTQPVNLALLGVAVPPGRHRVTVAIDGGPEAIAGAVSLAVLLAAAVVVLRPRRRSGGRERRSRDAAACRKRPPAVRPPRATSVAAVALPLAMLAWALLPVILGSETFFLRDLFAAQLGLREELADGLAAGRLPLVDAHRLGQPLAGNPNAAAFYPTAALHAVAPLYWSFSAHLWIHLFVAPFALAWLGRELGLGRRAAWAAGVSFAFCGYTASQLAFLNLIAGVTLAPALAAAVVGALARARRGRRRAAGACAAAAGALWGLILLGGDPMTAALAAGLAVAAAAPEMLARAGGEDVAVTARSRLGALAPGLALLALALAAGTLLALPQLVEFLRILPASARAQRGFSEGVRLAGSLDPRQAVEWLVPFAFGRPDLLGRGSFWGYGFYQGSWAFLYTLYPGLTAIALVAAAGLPWRAPAARPGLRRPALLGAALAAGGGFLALGAFNPLAAWLLTLPLLDVLRFPSKTWLLAAVGLSLVAGVGFERAVAGGDRAARRRALAALLAAGALLAGLWLALRTMPEAAARRFLAVMPEGAPEWMAAGEVARWAESALQSLAVAAVVGLLLLLAARRPRLAGALLVAVHAGSQLFFLAPARATDAVLPYTLPSRLLTALPADEVIVHGAAQDLFGEGGLRDGTFPDPLAAWIFRRAWHELYPMSGGLWDRRYDLVTSPEALDPLPTRQAFTAVEGAPDDRTRLRLLAAWGSERLILDRPLADADRAGLAEPVASAPSFRQRVWVYRLLDPTPPVHLAERVTAVETAKAAARRLGGEDFRRGEEAVVVTRGPGAPPAGVELPGLVEPSDERAPRPGAALPASAERPAAGSPRGGAGSVRPGAIADRPSPAVGDAVVVRIDSETAESLVADVDSPAGGLLVWRRAWLPIYRATVGGRPATPLAANIHHLAVPVPPGRHRVVLATDRRPLARSLLAAALGALTLLLLATWPRRRRSARPPPAT